MSGILSRRVLNEISKIDHTEDIKSKCGVTVSLLSDDNLMELCGELYGPPDTPVNNILFKFTD